MKSFLCILFILTSTASLAEQLRTQVTVSQEKVVIIDLEDLIENITYHHNTKVKIGESITNAMGFEGSINVELAVDFSREKIKQIKMEVPIHLSNYNGKICSFEMESSSEIYDPKSSMLKFNMFLMIDSIEFESEEELEQKLNNEIRFCADGDKSVKDGKLSIKLTVELE